MKTIARTLLVLALLAVLLPAAGAKAQNPPADPYCAAVAGTLGATSLSVWIGDSITCIMVPDGWNGDFVLFAHGYMDARQPKSIPWETQLITADMNLPAIVLNLGYGFATTSYSKNGLAIKQGVEDVVALAQYLKANIPGVQRVFLTGASEGGAVTALTLEKYPQYFAGGLSTCGPIGSFTRQVQYWGDFRVAFDSYFPNALLNPVGVPFGPSTPIYIDPFLVENWDQVRDSYILPMVAANPAAVTKLIRQTGVPIDLSNPQVTAWASMSELLYYNVEATNDGRLTLVPGANILPPSIQGNPYANKDLRIRTDPKALKEIAANYETSGNLSRQVVVMHTTGDPVIPFEQSLLYMKKVANKGDLAKLALIPIVRYGHCAFQPAEIVFGFYTMVIRSTLLPFSAAQIESALPDAKQQMEFKKLKEQHEDKVKAKD
jgi:hypothetical protein